MKKIEIKTKIIAGGVISVVATLLGFVGMMWLAIILWEANPAAPGIAAFVFGATYVIYSAIAAVYRAYINVLAAEDMAEEHVE